MKTKLDIPLGERLKGYESDYETSVEPEKHIIVRIDGHKFSKFTKGFKKPFDEILSKAMELTTIDLVEEFQAVTGYTQSDEITLVLPSFKDVTVDDRKSTKHKLHKLVKKDWNHAYSGRIQKMVSLIAGFTTMKFNKHLEDLGMAFCEDNLLGVYHYTKDDLDYNNVLEDRMGNAWFDARIYGVDSDDEAFNSVLWRVRDAEKNSRSMFAQTYCSHKSLHGLSGKEQVEFCLEKTGEDWEQVQDRYKYGILVKKEKYLKITEFNEFQKATNVGGVERTRIKSWAQHLTYSKENVKMIMEKAV